MVNVERYGGAGTSLPAIEVRGRPLPAPTFASQDTASFLIAVHELGHSFATLADEYADPAMVGRRPLPTDGSDLPHPNATLPGHIDVTDFDSVARTAKWKHFLALPGARKHRGAHPGGYFREHGVYRPFVRCRMLSNGDPFCPVCCEEMAKGIHAACGLPWDDAEFHERHPLSLWR
jgi:hypothetical protein